MPRKEKKKEAPRKVRKDKRTEVRKPKRRVGYTRTSPVLVRNEENYLKMLDYLEEELVKSQKKPAPERLKTEDSVWSTLKGILPYLAAAAPVAFRAIGSFFGPVGAAVGTGVGAAAAGGGAILSKLLKDEEREEREEIREEKQYYPPGHNPFKRGETDPNQLD